MGREGERGYLGSFLGLGKRLYVCVGDRAARASGTGTDVRAAKHQKRKQGSETGIQVPVVLVCKPSTGTHPHVDPQMGRGGWWGGGVWVMRLQEQLLLPLPFSPLQPSYSINVFKVAGAQALVPSVGNVLFHRRAIIGEISAAK